MGYQVDYSGQFNLPENTTPAMLSKLNKLCGADLWEMGYKTDCRELDLELTEFMTGLQHNGIEKSYEMDQQVKALLQEMRKDYPDFKLTGSLSVEDEFGDKYKVTGEGEKEFDTSY